MNGNGNLNNLALNITWSTFAPQCVKVDEFTYVDEIMVQAEKLNSNNKTTPANASLLLTPNNSAASIDGPFEYFTKHTISPWVQTQLI